VRLAKRTTNLFRPRDAATAPGLDVSGLDGVIAVDPASRTQPVAASVRSYQQAYERYQQHVATL